MARTVKVTIKDIARDLGLSPMAVSKALRGHADIGAKTRERVIKRAAELDYRVDLVARSMVTGKTFLVGLIVPDLMQSFFAEVATSCAARLAGPGYHVVIAHSKEDARIEREEIAILSSRQVDGFIIASAGRDAEELARLSTPFVLIDRQIAGLETSFVGSDDEAIGRMATSHLIEEGFRRIAHLGGPDLSTGEGRLAGYIAALEAAGLARDPSLIVRAGYDEASGYRATQALLARPERPDALVCFNDPVATGAMRAILEAGLAIPHDVALIGAANMRNSDLLQVPLSTIDQDTAAIGEQAADLLLELIDAKTPPRTRSVITPIRLVVRESSVKS